MSDSCGYSDRTELIAITVAHYGPVDVRIRHTGGRRTIENDPVTTTRSHYLGARRVGKLRQLGHSEPSGERERSAVLIRGIALVPALVGRRRIRNNERARIALHGDAIVLRARVVDALVFGPCVFGRWVAFAHARYLDVYARVEYDFFVCLTDD